MTNVPHRSSAFLLLFALGCADGAGGTAVGNPGQLDVIVTDVPYGVELESASFAVHTIELVSCAHDVEILRLDAVFDALAPSPVAFPGGEWCHTVVLPEHGDAFVVEGLHDEQPFSLGVPTEPFALPGRYTVDGDTVLVSLSLAGAVRADEASNAPPGEPEHDSAALGSWAPSVVGAGLFTTTDDDYAAAEEVPPEELLRACASAGGRPGALGLLVAGVLALTRRSRGR